MTNEADGEIVINAYAFFNWSDVIKDASPVTYTLYVSTDPDFGPGPTTHVYDNLTVSELTLPDALTIDADTCWKVMAVDHIFSLTARRRHAGYFRCSVE